MWIDTGTALSFIKKEIPMEANYLPGLYGISIYVMEM